MLLNTRFDAYCRVCIAQGSHSSGDENWGLVGYVAIFNGTIINDILEELAGYIFGVSAVQDYCC
jgi:hypothetical protein